MPSNELLNHNDPEWLKKGVDFNKIESGATVNGQTFIHNGQGWTLGDAAPGKVAGPSLGPQVDNGGVAGHQPSNPIPFDAPGPLPTPSPEPGKVASPNTGPMVDNGGVAGHQPPVERVPGPVSTTPAAPAESLEDTVKNAWLARAGQGTAVDPNDPNIRQQVDPFAAAQERSRREYESEAAERLSAQGMGDSGAMQGERRLGMERAGQATGMFESELIKDELSNRRSEIQDALNHLDEGVSVEKKMQLERDLADLNAAIEREGYSTEVNIASQGDATKRYGIDSGERTAGLDDATRRYGIDVGDRAAGRDDATKREGIASGERIGNSEIGVKRDLGNASNSNDLIDALLRNQQFGDGQQLDWTKLDWETSPLNPRNR